MTSRDFCYWLQGFFELNSVHGPEGITSEQTECIRKHLALVFKHEIDPSFPNQDALNTIHNKPPQGGNGGFGGPTLRC